MVDLIAKLPCDGMLPIEHGDCHLAEVTPECMTLISPYKGQEKQLGAALKAAHDFGFPAPNRTTGKAGARCVWFGMGQAMLTGPTPAKILAKHASVVDQSDGWVVVQLKGAAATATLARLTPLDLRSVMFKRGHTARSQLQHMTVSITRIGADAFEIMAFRSMAKTLVHDLKGALASVAAQ